MFTIASRKNLKNFPIEANNSLQLTLVLTCSDRSRSEHKATTIAPPEESPFNFHKDTKYHRSSTKLLCCNETKINLFGHNNRKVATKVINTD